ncbi:transposase [Streptomyces sp. 135]|uniref:transposase n=1 Tax=Streptomyces sp. 135 TaxID=2838850 RepID=UPI0021DB0E4F|nr:transposase [Streptomyces sp. 135]
MIRTVQLLRYLSDPALRRRVTAATNKTEAFNGFSQWIGFGNQGVIVDNDPVEQEKAMKCNALLTNAVIFHNALDIAGSCGSCWTRAGRSSRRTWPTSRHI